MAAGAFARFAATRFGQATIATSGMVELALLPSSDTGYLAGGYVNTGKACAVINGGDNLVYQSTSSGFVDYVGITNSLERRAAQHFGQKGISIDAIPGLSGLSRADARAVEQVLIEFYGLGKNGGSLLNKINSISQKNSVYDGSLIKGAELLKQAGYPGF